MRGHHSITPAARARDNYLQYTSTVIKLGTADHTAAADSQTSPHQQQRAQPATTTATSRFQYYGRFFPGERFGFIDETTWSTANHPKNGWLAAMRVRTKVYSPGVKTTRRKLGFYPARCGIKLGFYPHRVRCWAKTCHNIETRIFMGRTHYPLVFSAGVPRASLGKKSAIPIKTPDSEFLEF